jgi:hypothetical protein
MLTVSICRSAKKATFKLPYIKDDDEDMLMLMWAAGQVATVRFRMFLRDCLDGMLPMASIPLNVAYDSRSDRGDAGN